MDKIALTALRIYSLLAGIVIFSLIAHSIITLVGD